MAKKVTITEISFPKLDEQLRELARVDWEKFCLLTQIDKLQIWVCNERAKGRSIRQIARMQKLSRSVVETRSKKCPNCPDSK